MGKIRNFIIGFLIFAVAYVPWQINSAQAESASQKRQDARKAVKELIDANKVQVPAGATAWLNSATTMAVNPVYPPGIGFNTAVDYTKPNFAVSPNIRKFVDKLPGLGVANANGLGQYIPIATPDTTTYPGNDYYEIGIKEFTTKMNSDLPLTKLRGYYQKNGTGTPSQYLGSMIIAHRDRPVRLKVTNELPATGSFFLPVDMTVMGAGMGPVAGQMYTDNRADIHLHGGNTPWISDGTPHQWFTPAGTAGPATYQKGASFQNVPDMIGAGAGQVPNTASDAQGTYYYTNHQSGRLMFYHDHAYGITRLNVYAGLAAPYLLVDQVEDDLIDGTNISGGNPAAKQILPSIDPKGVYRYGIPLVIQDKSFVNNAFTPYSTFPKAGYTKTPDTNTLDPLWAKYVPGATGTGNLWFPHEYMPVENVFDPSGNTPFGRWDYAPFMIPPMVPMNLTLPSPTIVPESFCDSAVVNGCAFPYVELPPDVVRFRILNACNDRSLNLQVYKADPLHPTEVKMVPSGPIPAYPTWPADGRDGGVPDPTTQGPPLIQIGNECGFLAQPAVLPQQPVDFEYNRQNIPFGGVTSKTLLLMPAMRADVILDLSKYKAGDTLILYNDCPAPMPLPWPLNDYFTDGPDQTATGGPVKIPPGFGPNTRTLMQIRIVGTKTSTMDFSSTAIPGFNKTSSDPGFARAIEVPGTDGASLAALKTALPTAFAADTDPILVPQLAYNAAYPTGPLHYTPPASGPLAGQDTFVQSYMSAVNISGTAQPIARIRTIAPGNNYTVAPTVTIVGGGGTGATATAGLNPCGGITLLTNGSGYTSAPTVTVSAPGAGGVQCTAVATVTGGQVTSINIDEPGSNYSLTVAPTITITGGGGTGATASGFVAVANTVGSITVTNPGSGYTAEPMVYLTGGGMNGMAASAIAQLAGSLPMTTKSLTEGFDAEYGRMDIKLGSAPNPLTPAIGAGFVLGVSRYIDPPTEFMNDGETIIWRITHLGVDSHSLHFHLFNLQVVNRIDATNVIKPPYPDEIGWREVIRTNPLEDIVVAIKPISMPLPFQIPQSNRLLDPTTVLNSTANFYPVAPPAGIAAVGQLTNVMTNFGWEYVWHCHLLGHEENDMMRPMSLVVLPPVAPTNVFSTVSFPTPTTASVTLNWGGAITTYPNASGFTIQRSTSSTFPAASTTTFQVAGGNKLSYVDNTVALNAAYYYRVQAFNGAGLSAWSNTATAITVAPPTNFAGVSTAPGSVTLTWNPPAGAAGSITGYAIQRLDFLTGLTTSIVPATPTSVTQTGLAFFGWFRVQTITAIGNSAWSPIIQVNIL